MKKRMISVFCILCIALSLFTVPATAYNHTSYSQYGNVDKTVDKYLCYITCLAMAISDLGNPVTPLDVYNANGKTASANWRTLQAAYGITVKEIPLKSYTIVDGKSKIANLLRSGNYPQGIMLTIKWEKGWHAVLARKVVDGVIYCDDPARTSGGCCIPLEQCNHYTSNGKYAGIYSYRTIAKASSWPGKNVSTSSKVTAEKETSTLSITPTAYPTSTLKEGSRYSLKGTVTSNYNITSVKGEIINNEGNVVFSYTEKPNSKSFSILDSKLDANMKFNELSPGKYYLTYTAEDASGRPEGKKTWSSKFTIVGEEKEPSTLKIISDAYPTDTLTQGSRYSLKGTVISNYNITSVKGEIIDSNGNVVFSYTQRPNAKSFSILNSRLDANMKFNELSPGEYYLKYTAEDESEKSVDWLSRAFKVQGEQEDQQQNQARMRVTITFDPDGGSVSQKTKTVLSGDVAGTLPTPVREGYDFIHWAAEDGMIVMPDTVVGQDMTVYARWRPQPVKEEPNDRDTGAADDGDVSAEPKGCWGPWREWSSTRVSASDTRQVETREIKISDAYTEYRYGNYMNGSHDCWCPEYGATLPYKGSWIETYTPWSTTRKKDTGHNAFCSDKRHRHDHMDGRDSNGWANWSIYSDDGAFYNGRVYWYWEETRTVPAVYETQYRYRDWISN